MKMSDWNLWLITLKRVIIEDLISNILKFEFCKWITTGESNANEYMNWNCIFYNKIEESQRKSNLL